MFTGEKDNQYPATKVIQKLKAPFLKNMAAFLGDKVKQAPTIL